MDSTTTTYEPGTTRQSTSVLFDRADYFILTAAFFSFLFSIVLWFGPFGAPNKDGGLFVSVWVPSILALGCFAKLARKDGRNG